MFDMCEKVWKLYGGDNAWMHNVDYNEYNHLSELNEFLILLKIALSSLKWISHQRKIMKIY